MNCSATHSQTLLSKQVGWHLSSALGSGMDYAESRVYQQGDDPRYIDWRVSARSTETFVKTYHMESQPSLCLVLDKRRSMLFGTRGRLKVAQAMRVAVMLAYAAELHHIAVNVLVIDDQLHWVECFEVAGITASALIKEQNGVSLQSVDNVGNVGNGTAESSLELAIDEIQQRVPKGSLVYLISDFIDTDNADKRYFSQLQADYFVQAVHMMDQAEISMPALGNIRLRDMSTSQSYSLKTSQQSEQQAYNGFAEQQASLKQQVITESGIAYLRVMTDDQQIHQQLSLPLGKTA